MLESNLEMIRDAFMSSIIMRAGEKAKAVDKSYIYQAQILAFRDLFIAAVFLCFAAVLFLYVLPSFFITRGAENTFPFQWAAVITILFMGFFAILCFILFIWNSLSRYLNPVYWAEIDRIKRERFLPNANTFLEVTDEKGSE